MRGRRPLSVGTRFGVAGRVERTDRGSRSRRRRTRSSGQRPGSALPRRRGSRREGPAGSPGPKPKESRPDRASGRPAGSSSTRGFGPSGPETRTGSRAIDRMSARGSRRGSPRTPTARRSPARSARKGPGRRCLRRDGGATEPRRVRPRRCHAGRVEGTNWPQSIRRARSPAVKRPGTAGTLKDSGDVCLGSSQRRAPSAPGGTVRIWGLAVGSTPGTQDSHSCLIPPAHPGACRRRISTHSRPEGDRCSWVPSWRSLRMMRYGLFAPFRGRTFPIEPT
jgi:hypothetical protein